ncbi:hypothetical protein FA09DRAFT_193084 [Tilletiopsis washingtonensis]|uniref:Uncharacterized protein n=1 Tax=Tilletiopsis washingtonensis TaxID=58919 RepID=A0A316ZHU9_9BASI|nr:hypothetical protein FA09DRAFT_193084 [Tilletiopsis washingtonensis]PWO00605.1 hypothetical protein FA09DRAFT_193084 [Tilletiopsis washingtonensis]
MLNVVTEACAVPCPTGSGPTSGASRGSAKHCKSPVSAVDAVPTTGAHIPRASLCPVWQASSAMGVLAQTWGVSFEKGARLNRGVRQRRS